MTLEDDCLYAVGNIVSSRSGCGGFLIRRKRIHRVITALCLDIVGYVIASFFQGFSSSVYFVTPLANGMSSMYLYVHMMRVQELEVCGTPVREVVGVTWPT